MEELKVKEIAKMLFHHTKQFDNKLDCKLKKQEIVFDTAVFHYELTYTNNGWLEFKKALEERYKQNWILVKLTNTLSAEKIHPCQSELVFSSTCSHFVFFLRSVHYYPHSFYLLNVLERYGY